MLTASAIDRIRESVEAELGPRSTSLAAAIVACDSEFARHGAFNSPRRVLQRGSVACQELTIRAEIIWGLVQRCRPLFGELDDRLIDDLRQQIRDHLTAQASLVLEISGPQTAPQIAQCRDQLIRKFSSRARFFVEDDLKRPEVTTAGSFAFYGPVGAVQTGAYATAHVHIDAAGSARLIKTLENLRNELLKAADVPLEEREQGAELAADVIIAAQAPKPNGSKLAGLLLGLSMMVQTVASIHPAWDAVRQAALAVGIPLP